MFSDPATAPAHFSTSNLENTHELNSCQSAFGLTPVHDTGCQPLLLREHTVIKQENGWTVSADY
jgi:hypothetical protein